MQPCKGVTTACVQFDCALSGLGHRYGFTQGCARASLTLGYYIVGLSALGGLVSLSWSQIKWLALRGGPGEDGWFGD